MIHRPTFDEDVALMRRHAPIDVLEASGGGRIAVSARWQGRVMTTAVDPRGASLGFVHRAFLERGVAGTAFDNYGGEDRFWLGPEAGPYGLYFAPGAPFEVSAWQVPHALQEGEWSAAPSAAGVTFTRRLALTSYAGRVFDVAVERRVSALDAKTIEARFGAAPQAGARWVAFETVNVVTNAGAVAWTRETGLLSVWILGQFRPSDDTIVVVPFSRAGGGPVVNDAYFGRVPPDRLAVREPLGVVLFRADGRRRSKIGLAPRRARPTLGSYAPAAGLLTVVRYDGPYGERPYVNSLWEKQRDPYDGDAVNSYNDGPPAPGAPPADPFYELETSSPAAALAPGASTTYANATLHVVGEPAHLDPVARAALGVSVADVRM